MGLPWLGSSERSAGSEVAHPNGAVGIDHVVVATPDFDRTAAALDAAGLGLRRVRDAGGFRQGFRRLGPAILELVEAPARVCGRSGPVLGPGRDRFRPRCAGRAARRSPRSGQARGSAGAPDRDAAGVGGTRYAVAFMSREPDARATGSGPISDDAVPAVWLAPQLGMAGTPTEYDRSGGPPLRSLEDAVRAVQSTHARMVRRRV